VGNFVTPTLQCLSYKLRPARVVKLSLYLFNFGPEKGPLDVCTVLTLWLVLYVVALPIGDGLQHSHQGLHEVLQLLPPLKSCSKSDFRKKFANNYF
jgi:hypothetical protein